MIKRVLFLVNGLGLGNATRCHAVIEQLLRMNVVVAIVTSGNGVWYFKKNSVTDSVSEVSQFNYAKKDGRLSVLGTVISAPEMRQVLRNNSVILEEVIEEFDPDVVVADSVYAVGSIKRKGLPIVHLNNSDVVVLNKRKYGLPNSVKFQYYAIEKLDYLFHKLKSDLVLSPSLELDLPPLHKKIQRIAPIVRPGLRSAGEVKQDRAIIMLSGSSFGTQPELSETGFGMQVDVVGRGEPEGNNRDKSGIKFVGRTADSIRYINKANFAVVNGGFSAVSEMFVRRCPMVVVPVPGHSEQYVNAKTIERLGVGLIAEENELEEKLKLLIERGDEFTHSYSKFDAAGDGASLAAKSIVNIA